MTNRPESHCREYGSGLQQESGVLGQKHFSTGNHLKARLNTRYKYLVFLLNISRFMSCQLSTDLNL